VFTAIEMFTGKELRTETILSIINHPANAINLQCDAHDAMDQSLAWGIEAKLVKYAVRAMRLCGVADPDKT
jgi:hypothetical protein